LFRPDSEFDLKVRPSPNFGERAKDKPLDMIILHYTGMADGNAALNWLCNPDSGVSCHYFIDEGGGISQLVEESKRAWHAGKSCWKGETDINSRSIGIEIVNPGHKYGYRDFPDVQIEAVVKLCRNCGARWQVEPQNVLAHSDIAPLRKEDPGELFPWDQLHRAGIGHWVEPRKVSAGGYLQQGDEGEAVEALQAMLTLYGYYLEITGKFDELTASCITAFQRHFRPLRVDGVADQSTISTLRDLLQEMPETG